MMRCPPIEWEDLVALGMNEASEVSCDGEAVAINPQPKKIVASLLARMAVSPPPDGNRLAYLRHIRDTLMSLTDYTQANDSPLSESQRTAWATYRQALRDLPSVYSGEGPIPWPVAP